MPYITRLLVENCRNVRHLDLDLTPSGKGDEGREFKHLILTGPNGTGKTGVLDAVAKEIRANFNESLFSQVEVRDLLSQGKPIEPAIRRLYEQRPDRPAALLWTQWPQAAGAEDGQWFTLFLPASRRLELQHVSGPQRSDVSSQLTPINGPIASIFLQYLVNLKTEQAFAGVDKDQATVDRIGQWFEHFRHHVGFIVGDPELRLDFDRTNFNFVFSRSDTGYQFDLKTLSDGASSVVAILAELMLRVDDCRKKRNDPSFEPAGVVIIDEIETHLHLKLQEAILPFLTELFPRVQFIVATHSPAVIASIPGAVVHDLGSGETRRSEEFRGKSYGTLVTGYFGLPSDVDADTTEKLQRYQELMAIPGVERTADEEAERQRLRAELSERSEELAVKLWLADDSSPEEAAQ